MPIGGSGSDPEFLLRQTPFRTVFVEVSFLKIYGFPVKKNGTIKKNAHKLIL
jgi:hypothetical protein